MPGQILLLFLGQLFLQKVYQFYLVLVTLSHELTSNATISSAVSLLPENSWLSAPPQLDRSFWRFPDKITLRNGVERTLPSAGVASSKWHCQLSWPSHPASALGWDYPRRPGALLPEK